MSETLAYKSFFSLLVKDTLRELFTLMGPSALYLHPIPEFADMMPRLYFEWNFISNKHNTKELIKYVPVETFLYLCTNLPTTSVYRYIARAIAKYNRQDLVACLFEDNKVAKPYKILKQIAYKAYRHARPNIYKYIITNLKTPYDVLKFEVICGMYFGFNNEKMQLIDHEIIRCAVKYGNTTFISTLDKRPEMSYDEIASLGNHKIRIIEELFNWLLDDFQPYKSYIYAAKHNNLDTLEWLYETFDRSFRFNVTKGIPYYNVEVAVWIYNALYVSEQSYYRRSSPTCKFLKKCIHKKRTDIVLAIIDKCPNIDPVDILYIAAENGNKQILHRLIKIFEQRSDLYSHINVYDIVYYVIECGENMYEFIKFVVDSGREWPEHVIDSLLYTAECDYKYRERLCSMINVFEEEYPGRSPIGREIIRKYAEKKGSFICNWLDE